MKIIKYDGTRITYEQSGKRHHITDNVVEILDAAEELSDRNNIPYSQALVQEVRTRAA